MDKIIYILLIGLLLIPSCTKKENYTDPDVEIVGHGGMGFASFINTYPPNSMISVIKAIEGYGADGVEVDVQMDMNGQLWLFHDLQMDKSTDCSGYLVNKSSDYLCDCSYKSGFNFFQEEKLVRLEDVLEYFCNWNEHPLISLQINTDSRNYNIQELGTSLIILLEEYNAAEWVEITSESEELLDYIDDTLNNYSILLETQGINEGIEKCISKGWTGIITANDNITEQQVRQAKDQNLKVSVFNVCLYYQIREALEKGPDQIQTDDIELLIRMSRE